MDYQWNRISSWINVIAVLCFVCGVLLFLSSPAYGEGSGLISLMYIFYGLMGFVFWRAVGIVVKAAEYYIDDKEGTSYETEDTEDTETDDPSDE